MSDACKFLLEAVYGAVHCGHPNDHSLLDQFQFCFHRNEKAAGGKCKEDDALTVEF